MRLNMIQTTMYVLFAITLALVPFAIYAVKKRKDPLLTRISCIMMMYLMCIALLMKAVTEYDPYELAISLAGLLIIPIIQYNTKSSEEGNEEDEEE